MKIVLPTLHVRRSLQAIPLAAGCLVAALPKDARNTSIILNFFPEDPEREILKKIVAYDPDMVAFPVYSWNRLQVIHLANELLKLRPELMLVAGGPEVTGDPEGMAAAAPWRALLHGEGEESFPALVAALSHAPTNISIAGVTWRPESGQEIKTAPGRIKDIRTLPSPWLQGILKPTPDHGVLWEVARGCAFACDYCFDGRGHDGVRAVDRNRLIEELALFEQMGVTHVWVLDSTFNYPPERGVKLLQTLIEHAPGLHYHFEAKTDYIDRQTARLLSRLNCSVQLGVQTIQRQVLQAVHRPLDLNRLDDRVHMLANEGVTYGFDLIYGLPSDNYEGFRQSIDSLIALAPNHLHIFPLSLLPGTRLAKYAAQFELIAQSAPPYQILSSKSWTPEDLERSRRLSAVIDLFYNTGRAVAFFQSLMHTLETTPSTFFEDFCIWILDEMDIDLNDLLDIETWSANDAYRLQQDYLSRRLLKCGKGHLVTAVLDLLCYHFNYAETLLGEDLPPVSPSVLDGVDCWEVPWQRAKQLRMAPFAYEVYDLLEIEEMELTDFVELFRPVGSVAAFVRRGEEVYCESLGEDSLRLLKNSDGQRTPNEIFAGTLCRETGEELVASAVYDGLLQPVSKEGFPAAVP